LSLGRLGQLALLMVLLYWGRPVLVPLALSLYLAFVLTPAESKLEQLGFSRGLAVTTTLGTALAGLSVLGAILVAQVADLASKMHGYTVQMANKMAGLRGGSLRIFSDCSRAISELARSVEQQIGGPEHLTAVRVVPGGGSAMQRLEETFGPLLQPVASALLVLVLTVFVLAHREDLRARLILLLGPKNVTLTTRTMTEAFTRVSHLLLAQAYINGCFGGVIALGLYVIGVPYALLWGAVAGLLRFVPLLGPWIATLLPALLAFVTFPGWQHALLTIGLFLVVDLTLANFIEPLVLGKRTGVSALALLVSAVFWTWLWGALGLLLATPITVCAAVIGRHVPDLNFLAVALGDEPGLNPELNFYQRTLARASKDAYRLARRHMLETSLIRAFDELLIPALRLMQADRSAHAINEEAASRFVGDLETLVTRLRNETAAKDPRPLGIVVLAAESDADALLMSMLAAALAERGVAVSTLAAGKRTELIESALAAKPARICVAGLPPGSNSNARFLCRRLRAELPKAPIVVFAPEAEPHHSGESEARLREAGASRVAASLTDAVEALLQEREHASGAGAESAIEVTSRRFVQLPFPPRSSR
jgi:predicted PurR-regulated permease PerM